MKRNRGFTRRDFIKGTIGAGIVIAGADLLTGCKGYDAKGLPTTVLGKTGVRIPRMAIGLGSRWCSVESEDKALELLAYALDNGLYYWDTAHTYTNPSLGIVSEERIGKLLASRRDEVFISTKVASRDPEEAKRQIELSLKRLQTDHVDMLKIHSVLSMDDVDALSARGGLIEVITKMKEEGITRFIGYSGHANAEAMKTMTERGDFDNMLIAMNHYGMNNDPQPRQELAVPAALDKGMGVMLMKSVRPKETIPGMDINDLVRFALSLKGPKGVVVGMDSMEVVKANLEILRNFTPLSDDKMKKLAMTLTPFFNHKNLEWMRPGYHDGTRA